MTPADLVARIRSDLAALEVALAPAPAPDPWVDQSDPLIRSIGARRYVAAIRSGQLPGRCIGRRWLARRDDFEAWLSNPQ